MSTPFRALFTMMLLSACSPAIAAALDDMHVPAARIAIDDEPAGSAGRVIAEAAAMPAFTVPLAARVVFPGSPNDPALAARLATFRRLRTPVWLSLRAPAAQDEIERWRVDLRALLEQHGSSLTVVEVDLDLQPARAARFAVQVAATEVRSGHAAIRVAIGGPAMADGRRREEIYSSELAPYVDLLAIAEGGESVAPWLHRIDPLARVVLTPLASDAAAADSGAFVEGVLHDLGSEVVMHAWRPSELSGAALRALASLTDLLTDNVVILDDAAVGLELHVGPRDVTASTPHRVLFDDRTFSTFLVYSGSGSELEISILLPVEGLPGVRDPLKDERRRASGYTRDAAAGRVHAMAALTGRPMVVDFNEGAADMMVQRTGVVGDRSLSIGEIIARHQQQQRAQDLLVRNYTAHARMQQHFRPTVTDPGYDVLTENRYFVAGAEVEWEELSFSVNGSKWGADRPAFPLLQPEKVLSLPLQLRFDEGYRYRLAGSEMVDELECYIVRFEPIRQNESLYRGTLWIEKNTFGRVKVQATQGGLSAPVVSNDETQLYRRVIVGNRPTFLFSSLSARQILLIAGRNLLLEKEVAFSEFKVNDAGFEQERDSARGSDRVMYRETDRGLRYFVKEGSTRVVSDRATNHAKAMAMGVTIDPSYSFPLPIVGINYLNFNFGSPNQQLAILFAGVLAAGNIQRSKIGNTHLDASVDFFAIAVPSSDRLYTSDSEVASERVLTWPLSTGFNLGWQATPFQKATLQYQARFDAYVKDRTTADNFDVPSSTVTHGIGAAWEYRRGGYSLLLNGTWFGRATWAPWGLREPGATAATTTSPRTYEKYSAGLSRDFYLNAFHKLHLNAAWYGGLSPAPFGKYEFRRVARVRPPGVPATACGIRQA